jgi:hypothetical protein
MLLVQEQRERDKAAEAWKAGAGGGAMVQYGAQDTYVANYSAPAGYETQVASAYGYDGAGGYMQLQAGGAGTYAYGQTSDVHAYDLSQQAYLGGTDSQQQGYGVLQAGYGVQQAGYGVGNGGQGGYDGAQQRMW